MWHQMHSGFWDKVRVRGVRFLGLTFCFVVFLRMHVEWIGRVDALCLLNHHITFAPPQHTCNCISIIVLTLSLYTPSQDANHDGWCLCVNCHGLSDALNKANKAAEARKRRNTAIASEAHAVGGASVNTTEEDDDEYVADMASAQMELEEIGDDGAG
jgi:hypothetical protein